ncbi:MAG TPA: rhomboid family intramembrane serine protease [Candidatus Acidoferrum sp.]|nr:rhomboid family intramembrane serine protease [Candidatus Acidoferrum sp.]
MNPIWIACSAFMVVSGLVCWSYLLYERRKLPRTPFPLASVALIALLTLTTALQFVYPEWLTFMRRNPEGFRAGEVWRVITPIFVQPDGIGQCIVNACLVLVFMPYAEKLYGRSGMLTIFFAAGLGSQVFTFFWLPYGGGTSSAAFGLIGGLYGYLLRHRKQVQLPFVIIPSIGLLIAMLDTVSREGHGPGLLIGAATSLWLSCQPYPERAAS